MRNKCSIMFMILLLLTIAFFSGGCGADLVDIFQAGYIESIIELNIIWRGVLLTFSFKNVGNNLYECISQGPVAVTADILTVEKDKLSFIIIDSKDNALSCVIHCNLHESSYTINWSDFTQQKENHEYGYFSISVNGENLIEQIKLEDKAEI